MSMSVPTTTCIHTKQSAIHRFPPPFQNCGAKSQKQPLRFLYERPIMHFTGGMKTKPDGTTETLNDNGDLWWSLLGGGGGVYGIVTQFKYRLHDPPDGFVRMSVVFPIEWHKVGCVGIAEQVSLSGDFKDLSM